MLSDWIYKKDNQSQVVQPLALIIAAFAGGYTVADYPKDFLDLFTNPIGQFIIFYIILYIAYYGNPQVKQYDLIIEALLGVLIIQSTKLVLRKIYKK